MKRTIGLIVFGVLVFAGIVLARLPASWVLPGAKSGMTCSDAAGTAWNGSCTGLTVQNQLVGDLSWEVHAMRLLSGKLNADIVVMRPAGSVTGNVESSFDKKVVARDVVLDLLIDQELAAALGPSLRGLRGKVHAQLPYLRLDGQVIKAVEGVIEVHDLTDASQQWGSYSVTFPPPTTHAPVGHLKDLGNGPIAFDGALKLSPAGFVVDGLIAPRPSAPPELVQDLRVLGSPDAQGRRPFSYEFNF